MNTESYLKLTAQWAPRLIESIEEYREAVAAAKTVRDLPPTHRTDAAGMYADLVEKLALDYRQTRLHELTINHAPDSRVIGVLRLFNPTHDERLFELTGITPKRWDNVINGHPLDRKEIAILCQVFKVEPGIFNYSLKHDYVYSTKLKLVDSAMLRPQLVHLRTKTKRPLPEQYLEVVWEDEDGGSACLTPAAPAWKYHIHEYVASHEDELMRKVFPEFDAEDRKAEAAVEEE